MRTIYCYHFKTINENRVKLNLTPLFKIGDTTIEAANAEEAANIRIQQQDTTSCFEELIMDWAESVPDDFYPTISHIDKKFHEWLRKTKNIYKYRKDADREWFAFKDADEAKSYLNEFLTGTCAPNSWQMRRNQQEGHDKIVSYFRNGGSEFLLAAKMRFGKNFTFLNVIKTLGYKNVLVLTYKPTVFESLEDDIKTHINFVNDFEYILYKDTRDKLTLTDKVNIVSCSAQMAGYKYSEETGTEEYDSKVDIRKNLHTLSKINWDLIVTDECHYGTDTENFKNICNILNCNRILYISGTPFKTIGNFSDDALYMYTYLDEQNEPDNVMPKLYQYGIKMSSSLIQTYKKNIEIVDYPTMTKVFQCSGNNFTYPDVAKGTLDDVLKRGIRMSGMDNIKHMFILFDHVDACVAAAKYINEQYGHDYIAINLGGETGIKDVSTLKSIIAEANADGKGTISISCGRFIEGVSVKDWNAVIMLNDGKSPERYFQAMFRGQTPVEWKKNFYVIDYNPERMLELNYKFINELPTENKSRIKSTREDNIRNWLKASPIVIMENDSDQTLRTVDYLEIERTYFNNGETINKFADSSIFNRIHNITLSSDDCCIIMNELPKVSGVLNKDCILNTNELTGGKNKVAFTDKKKQKSIKKETSKEYCISDVIASIKKVITYIPKFLVCYNCHTLEDIIKKLHDNTDEEVEYFETEVGINYLMFIDIIKKYNIINIDGFQFVCNEFWRQYNYYKSQKESAKQMHKFCIQWYLYK